MGTLAQQRRDRSHQRVSRATSRPCCWPRPPGRAPHGARPGIRTGVKVAVVDETGQGGRYRRDLSAPPKNDWDGSLHTLAKLAEKHRVAVISIGNGTASRETDKLGARPDQAAP